MRHSRLLFLLCSVLPCAAAQAQSPSGNYVLVREMLDSVGTDSRVRLQYYDGIGRPTQQVESQGGGAYSATLTEYGVAYEYDVMGNVTRLDRRGLLAAGKYDYIDRLRYKYVGNHVVRIDDAVEDVPTYKDAFHFVDGADNDDEYTYDANGNMTKDLNKGITGIEYNCLNLPQRIHFNSPIQNKTITYGYNADGTKTSATYTTFLQIIPWSKNVLADGIGRTRIPLDSVSVGDRPVLHPDFVLASNRTDYCGNIIYECDTLKRVLIDGGYITFAGTKGGVLSSPLYHYYVKDHLGNNRVVVNGDGKVEETNSYYPYGGLMADNTNINSVQPYKYIGKEFDGMYGWNMLDHGARWYDAASIVWRNMDELAESNFACSPYVQSHDNPIARYDEHGKTDYYFNRMGQMHVANNFRNFIEKIKLSIGKLGNQDRIVNENNYNCIVSLPYGTIQNFNSTSDNVSFEIRRRVSANRVYNALLQNTNVEWAAIKHEKNGKHSYTIVTNYDGADVSSIVSYMRQYENAGEKVIHMVHSHPKLDTDTDSNMGAFESSPPSKSDLETAKKHPETVFFIYNLVEKSIQYYDGNGVYKEEKPLRLIY